MHVADFAGLRIFFVIVSKYSKSSALVALVNRQYRVFSYCALTASRTEGSIREAVNLLKQHLHINQNHLRVSHIVCQNNSSIF
jgi:hypothetical protein